MTRRELLDLLVERGEMERGTIEEFQGTWLSGLAYLVVDGRPVTCENAPTVRALDACFGDAITSGHCVNIDAIQGKEIYYSVDAFGLLEGFSTVDDPEMDAELDLEVVEGILEGGVDERKL